MKPYYSFYLAVLCSGLVLLGFITTSAIGNCGKSSRKQAVVDDDEDEEVGTTAASQRKVRVR